MPTQHLWPAAQDFALDGTHSIDQTLGIAFTPGADVTLVGLRYAIPEGMSAGDRPVRVRVWRNSDGHVMADTTAVGSSTAVGWYTITLASDVALASGVQYRVGYDQPNGAKYIATSGGTGVPAPDSPLAIAASGKYVNATGYGFPDTIAGGYIGIDVVTTTPDPAGTGTSSATTADVVANAKEWFSSVSGENLHHTGLPWLIGAEVEATGALVDLIPKIGGTDWTKVGDIWKLAGDLTDAERAVWRAFFDQGEDRITGPDASGGSAFYTPDGALVAQLVAEIHQMLRSYRNLVTVGGAGWSLSAEEDFEDAIAFAEPADSYILTITSYQDTQPATESPAGLWLPRLGWWCVLSGDSASQRQFVDFQNGLLSDGGRRMPGCAIQLRPGTLASVQAWLLA